jgi:uncharacterized protein YcgL (UPF0745 family)
MTAAPRPLLCEVFRSPRHEGMYLYVARSEGLGRVPETLLARFGEPQSALVFKLDSQRRLARADSVEVLAAIAEQGFYLQLPPRPTAAQATVADAAPGEDAC